MKVRLRGGPRPTVLRDLNMPTPPRQGDRVELAEVDERGGFATAGIYTVDRVLWCPDDPVVDVEVILRT